MVWCLEWIVEGIFPSGTILGQREYSCNLDLEVCLIYLLLDLSDDSNIFVAKMKRLGGR